MVLPLPGIEFIDDSVIPIDARPYFIALRYALISEMVLAMLRLSLGDIAGSLSDIICILFGIFFMRQDQIMRRLYLPLENSSLSVCCNGGGFRVLMPFCFVSALNGAFNLLIFVQIPIIVPYTIITSLLGVVDLICVYLGFQIYKRVSAFQFGGGLTGRNGGGPGSLFGGGGPLIISGPNANPVNFGATGGAVVQQQQSQVLNQSQQTQQSQFQTSNQYNQTQSQSGTTGFGQGGEGPTNALSDAGPSGSRMNNATSGNLNMPNMTSGHLNSVTNNNSESIQNNSTTSLNPSQMVTNNTSAAAATRQQNAAASGTGTPGLPPDTNFPGGDVRDARSDQQFHMFQGQGRRLSD